MVGQIAYPFTFLTVIWDHKICTQGNLGYESLFPSLHPTKSGVYIFIWIWRAVRHVLSSVDFSVQVFSHQFFPPTCIVAAQAAKRAVGGLSPSASVADHERLLITQHNAFIYTSTTRVEIVHGKVLQYCCRYFFRTKYLYNFIKQYKVLHHDAHSTKGNTVEVIEYRQTVQDVNTRYNLFYNLRRSMGRSDHVPGI
jgi:hypothetical protein